MATFNNVRFLNIPTKTNRQIVAVDITFNGQTYDWAIYTPLLNGVDLNNYFTLVTNIIQSDIENKEQVWANYPRTETINDGMGGTITVDIPKDRIVHPTMPDYIEALADTGYNDQEKLDAILNELPNNYWHYTQYAKRIIAPVDLIMDDIGVKMYNWFQINHFPVLKFGDNVELYCNTILPQHQAIVDSLQGVIVIEDRP